MSHLQIASDYFRQGSYDSAIWSDVYVNNEYALTTAQVSGRTILDIGGHIGSFALKCIELAAARVVSVEPSPGTACVYRSILSQYIMSGRAVLLEYGCLHVNGLLQALKIYPTNHSADTLVFNNKAKYTGPIVKTIAFDDLVKLFQPEVIKIDCEGAEYVFMRNPLPQHVKLVWIEFHDVHGPFASRYKEIVTDLSLSGFTSTIVKDHGSNVVHRFSR